MTEAYDPKTGEVLEPEAETPPMQQARVVERAADGVALPGPTCSTGNFLDLIEDGQFSADVYDKLRELGQKMTDIGHATGSKTKGKLRIDVELMKDGDHFTLQAKYKVEEPELPRAKSVMWTNQQGDFTRFPPNQTQLFSNRPVRRV